MGADNKRTAKSSDLPDNLPDALKIIEDLRRANRGLELRKAQYDSILENMTEFVERSDPNFLLTYVNEAMCELNECTAKDLIGKNTMSLLDADHYEQVLGLINGISMENPVYHYEYCVKRGDGSVRWIEGVGRGFYDADGKIIEYQDVGHDITHYKNLEQELQNTVDERTEELENANAELITVNTYLQNILEGISEGIIVVDSNGACEFLNYGPESKWRTAAYDIGVFFSQLIMDNNNNVINRLVGSKTPFVDVEMHCATKKLGQLTFVVSGMPLKGENQGPNKGILVLKPIDQVRNMVNKMSGAQSRLTFADIVTNSAVLQDAIALAKQGSNSDCTILIEGQSGTGKELFAQSINSSSPRRNGPFVAINRGAIPRELLASELFGYAEGAFTGAKKGGKPGKFELACGGALFLDEIGDMPMDQQIALLRVLQEKVITRVGGDREIPIDVRIICATNHNLLHEVTEKNFREDLYYRLNVINFHIPPLCERKEDILLLFSTFLRRGCSSEKFIQHIDPEVLEALVRYDWPGNVRELQNVAERMLYLSDGQELLLRYLPEHILNYQPHQKQKDQAKDGRERAGAQALSLEAIRRQSLGLIPLHSLPPLKTVETSGVSSLPALYYFVSLLCHYCPLNVPRLF